MTAAELTIPERWTLGTSGGAASQDQLSEADRSLISTLQLPTFTVQKRKYYSRGQVFRVEWQGYDELLPVWFDPLMQGFVDLLTLTPDWNSYGAGSIDSALVHEAMEFMNDLLSPSNPAPRVVPLSSGGLQLEWHRRGVDLEIVFDRGEAPYFYYRNRMKGEESELALPENKRLLGSIIKDLE